MPPVSFWGARRYATVLVAAATVAGIADVACAQAGKSTANVGLLNQWLRDQSPAWQAWDVGGEVRARYESFHNAGPFAPTRDFQSSGVDNDNDYLWTREKLHLGYTSKWVKAYAEGRNSNASGDEDTRNPGEDSFDLQQAWLLLGNAAEFPLTLQVGRQEFAYGDERFLGRSDWGNVTRSFDAVKLRYESKPLWVDVFAGRVVVARDGKFNQSDEEDWLSGVYASSKSVAPWQETQLYFLARNVDAGGRAGTSSRDVYTVGFRFRSLPGKLGNWDYTVEAAHQFGNITQSGVNRDQDAWAASAGGGYTWKDLWGSPRLGVEYNFSSGDSDPRDGKNETLDNLFPTNHKHYGLMDLVGWRNIHNPRLSLAAKPHKQVSANLDYHLFWLADTADYFYPQGGSGRNGLGYGRNPGYDSFVGSEVDLDIAYSPTSWAAIRAGYGHFFVGDYIKQSKASRGGATDADWFYVQAQITF